MSLFRTLAYLAPLIVGFGVAAALALTAERPAKRRALAAGAVPAVVLLLLLPASFTESPAYWGPLAVLLLALALLVAGVFLICEAARAPRGVPQIVASLAVCFLMSTIFWGAPIIRSAADSGASGAATYRWITLAMDVNPFFVMGYSIFNTDLLLLPVFYRTDLAGFQRGMPSWPATSAGYALAGAVLAALSAGLRRTVKR